MPFGSIKQRETEILGQPPRIPPLDRVENEHKVRDVTRALRAGIVRDETELSLEAIPEIMFTLCHHPNLWGKIMALSLQMQGDTGVLPPRDRQLAILRTGWLLQAPYEWGQHVQWSKLVGITSEEIERVTVGSAAPEWTAHERAVLQAAEELREHAMVSDATWAKLAERLDDRQLFELLALIGQFTTIAYVQNGIRLRLEPGNAGLSAR
jgi:4-carboxymuconolactone decarboxylase